MQGPAKKWDSCVWKKRNVDKSHLQNKHEYRENASGVVRKDRGYYWISVKTTRGNT